MFKLKIKAMFFLVLVLVILNSCKTETTEDIGKKIDTVATNIGKEIDTLAKNVTGAKDTLFDKIKVMDADTTGKAPDNVRSRLNGVFSDYIDIKNALADNDSSKAVNEANQLKKSLEGITDTSMTEKMRTGWKSGTAKVNKAADDIAAAKTLEDQRKAFSQLSEGMMSLIKTYGLNGRTVYVLQCSDTKIKYKAVWLVDSKDSDNPYAGGKASDADDNKSAKCGEVKEAWKFD
jgi:hypothetical protein